LPLIFGSAFSDSASAWVSFDHLRPALLELFSAHRDAHEFIGPPEVLVSVPEVHGVDEHAGARSLQIGERRLLHETRIGLSLAQGLEQIHS